MTVLLDETRTSEAAALLRQGALVAFATETVYGLGADATNGDAVARIFEAKGRPTFNPLIVHVPDLAAARALADVPPVALALAQRFWPGPLTMILPRRADSGLSDLVSAGLPTVALRVPGHEGAQALLRATGRPIAAPSANPSGRLSPTSAAQVMAGLDGRIDAVLDLGPCAVGLESTVLAFEGGHVLLARAGGVPVEDIESALGRPLRSETSPDKVISPGQLTAHYAPRAGIRIDVAHPAADDLFLAFGPDAGGCLNLSPSGDLREAAANLFGYLHHLDAIASQSGQSIAVAPIPETGLGRAINDRLRRAAEG